jgi:hypothetical protein
MAALYEHRTAGVSWLQPVVQKLVIFYSTLRQKLFAQVYFKLRQKRFFSEFSPSLY